MSDTALTTYRVGDLSTRLFHWIKISAIVGLMIFGLLMLFKKDLGSIHLYTAFTLLFVIITHIIAVIVTDAHDSGSIISAIFTGKKVLSGKQLHDASRYNNTQLA